MSNTGISKTAAGPLYLRTGCGIPFADEIARIANAKKLMSELVGKENLRAVKKNFGAWAELRFRSLSAAVQNYTGILELAAGFSPRGFIFEQHDPSIRYISTDVVGIYAKRIEVLSRVDAIHPTYWIVDATKPYEVVSCDGFFVGRKLAVINEGLLGYLTHVEKLNVLNGIRSLLEHCGGVWWTTDIHTTEEVELVAELSENYLSRFEKGAGRTYLDKAFSNLNEAEALMRKAGFRVERHEQLEFAPSLLSPVPNKQVQKMLKNQHLWKMTPA